MILFLFIESSRHRIRIRFLFFVRFPFLFIESTRHRIRILNGHMPSLVCCDSTSFSANMEDEYEKFIRRMNPPTIVIDNESCKNATIIQVDSANKHGILLEVVQVLTDLKFLITKAYISSDGGWFMDGNKITDEVVLDYITVSDH